jgi:release factor glutamine methyltransferase
MSYQQLWNRLAKVYGEGEAKAIARMVYEVRYGLSLSDLLMGRDASVPSDELEHIAQRLERHEPVQYILGETDFCGRTFQVNSHVLIPRPETEDLCRWILSSLNGQLSMVNGQRSMVNGQWSILNCLDIGTGSGCIAVTLAAELPGAQVTACDISEEALKVARENAHRHHVQLSFAQVDILSIAPSLWRGLGEAFTLIVSNPPYICEEEKEEMERNVLEHEPSLALFVPDKDPLLFYRRITDLGCSMLAKDGMLFFEINRRFGKEVVKLLHEMGYRDVELRQDMFGNDRMVKAIKPQ